MNNQEYTILLTELKALKSNGLSQEDITKFLKQKDLSIMTAIRVNRELFNMSLQEAKEYVATSADYKEIHEASKFLHDELMENFRVDRTG